MYFINDIDTSMFVIGSCLKHDPDNAGAWIVCEPTDENMIAAVVSDGVIAVNASIKDKPND